MADDVLHESADLPSPGAMLKAAREDQEISEREAADRLNWMPGYVAIVECDDYAALRSPSFAKGYVKAFGRLVGLDEDTLMAAFDAVESRAGTVPAAKTPSTPLQLQKTGLGVAVGLGSLSLLIAALWWWQGAAS